MALKSTKMKAAIGRQIWEMRNRRGLSQMQLAEKLGTSPTNISYWETGKTIPDSGYLEKICNEFGVELRFIQK
jgi:transcriptional regulator with XRE-family HTH domain